MRVLPAGFVPPCLPTKAQEPPSGPMWLHEIKHDGFRVVARKDGAKLRLYSRPDNDLTFRFPLIVEALARLRSKSCIIDGRRSHVMATGCRPSTASDTGAVMAASANSLASIALLFAEVTARDA
jgi:ATP-dependent DNA ligase